MATLPQLPQTSAKISPPREVMVALSYGSELARHGALLVPTENRPASGKHDALSLFQTKFGSTALSGQSKTQGSSDSRLLHNLLQDTLSASENKLPMASIPRQKQAPIQRAMSVRVIPGPGFTRAKPETKTALLLRDRDTALLIEEQVLTSLYGLTRNEAALAAKLMQGKSIQEAADELGISPSLVRTHLKRILMKADTYRPIEKLVRCQLSA